jgi:hypothetical protein
MKRYKTNNGKWHQIKFIFHAGMAEITVIAWKIISQNL